VNKIAACQAQIFERFQIQETENKQPGLNTKNTKDDVLTIIVCRSANWFAKKHKSFFIPFSFANHVHCVFFLSENCMCEKNCVEENIFVCVLCVEICLCWKKNEKKSEPKKSEPLEREKKKEVRKEKNT
jgi:hypothetical protein